MTRPLKLVNILLTLASSLEVLMLPRVASLWLQEITRRLIRCTNNLIYNLAYFSQYRVGVDVNDDFVRFFLREGFPRCRYAIVIMIFRMFFIGSLSWGSNSHPKYDKNRGLMLPHHDSRSSVGLNLPSLPHFGLLVQPLYPS